MKKRTVSRAIAATLFVACVVFSPRAVLAALTPVSPEAASAVAGNWLRLSTEMNWSQSLDSEPPALETLHYQGELIGYLAQADGGYVVLPAYTELPPISAYSTTASFNAADEGGFVLLLKEALAYKIEVARTVLGTDQPLPEMRPALEQIETDRRQWAAYAGSFEDFTRALEADNRQTALDDQPELPGGRYGIASVEPFVTSTWHQGLPYYNLNPMGDGGRTWLGCVATACAQILYYWRHPDTGTGSHSYYWAGDNSCGNDTPSRTLSASYTDAYDWDNMLGRYGGSEPQIQKDAVAELNYEVAVALESDFGRCATSANTADVLTILPQHFRFATDIDRENRNAYTVTGWFAMLQENLNQLWPMQYRISGHSIVCDGWRVSGTNQLHFNYGWSDTHTAWYTVDNLYCNWSGCNPQIEYVIRNIHPVGGGNPTRSVTVTSPNGGESWTLGAPVTITWTSANLTENVRIELNRDYPDGSWQTLATATPNDGSFAWTVSGALSSEARVRISGAVTTTVTDLSDENFSISGSETGGSLTITTPDAGDTLRIGLSNRVRWTSSGLSGNLRVELNRNYPTGSWETIVGNTQNDGGHSWNVNGPSTTNARIRVMSLTSPGVGDTTARLCLADTASRSLSITYPTTSAIWVAGNTTRVRWTSFNLTGNVRVEINRTYPSGTWETIVANTQNDEGHSWLVTGPSATDARVRVISLLYPTVGDTVNYDIAITVPGSPPGGGEGSPGPVPEVTQLDGAFPNPFNPVTSIRYQLAEATDVRLELFDITGRQAALLHNGPQVAGHHAVPFNGAGLASGSYFLRLEAGAYRKVQRIQLMK